MPTRGTNIWLTGLARGLTSGALVLTVFSWGGSALPASSLRLAAAEDIDCYNDKDLYNLPECVERRANDVKTGNQQTSTVFAPPPGEPGQQPTGGGQPSGGDQTPPSGGGQPQQANNPPPSGGGNQGQQQQQQQQQSNSEDEGEKPRGPATDPSQIILTLADAGKQATDYGGKEGTDKYGRWVQQRYERDRSDGASTLGPNVIDTKAWVTKDVETAKALFKEQAAIKDFPERKESVTGPNETVKPACPGEECSVAKGYWQDDKLWQHLRYVIRQGKNVSVLYLFGRDDFFFDRKEKTNTWNGAGDWYPQQMADRM
jgi:hypothetical protein